MRIKKELKRTRKYVDSDFEEGIYGFVTQK
jgi:hypothetical protein